MTLSNTLLGLRQNLLSSKLLKPFFVFCVVHIIPFLSSIECWRNLWSMEWKRTFLNISCVSLFRLQEHLSPQWRLCRRRVKRSTLSDAGKQPPWRAYDLFQSLEVQVDLSYCCHVIHGQQESSSDQYNLLTDSSWARFSNDQPPKTK